MLVMLMFRDVYTYFAVDYGDLGRSAELTLLCQIVALTLGLLIEIFLKKTAKSNKER